MTLETKIATGDNETRVSAEVTKIYKRALELRGKYLRAQPIVAVNLDAVVAKEQTTYVAMVAGDKFGYEKRLVVTKLSPVLASNGKLERGAVCLTMVFFQFEERVTPENYLQLLDQVSLDATKEGLLSATEEMDGVECVVKTSTLSSMVKQRRIEGAIVGSIEKIQVLTRQIGVNRINEDLVGTRTTVKMNPGYIARISRYGGKDYPCDFEIDTQEASLFRTFRVILGRELNDERIYDIRVAPNN